LSVCWLTASAGRGDPPYREARTPRGDDRSHARPVRTHEVHLREAVGVAETAGAREHDPSTVGRPRREELVRRAMRELRQPAAIGVDGEQVRTLRRRVGRTILATDPTEIAEQDLGAVRGPSRLGAPERPPARD